MSALRPTETEALAAWAELVAADADQVTRVREPEPPADHYQRSAAMFRAGMRPASELPMLLDLSTPADTWLDIGAGGGRLAVPLAAHVERVIAVEPSLAQRTQLAAAIEEAAVTNIEVRDARWPDPAWDKPVDVAFAAHSVYDIAAIGPFLDAMERHARRRCVVLLRPWARGAALAPLFEAVHGEPLHTLPALREFVALLAARGRRYEVRTVDAPAAHDHTPRDQAFEEARRLLWLAEGSQKDQRMRALMAEWWGTTDGIAVPSAPPYIAAVSWVPPGA